MAAEYVLKEGNPNVMLCERGIRTFETAYRFTLDLTAVPVLKELSAPAGDRRPEPRRRPARRSSSRCRWPRRRSAPTASSSRCTRSPRRRSATARSSSYADGFAEYADEGRARRGGRRQGAVDTRAGVSTVARARRVLGVGLIGGSVGLAARERLGAEVTRLGPGAGRPRAPRWSAARSTAPRPAPPTRWTGAEAAFVAAPVGALPAAVRAALAAAGADCVVTDVGSTKRARRRGRGRRALHRRPSAGGRRDGGRRARARRPVRRRDLVPDADAAHARARCTSACTACSPRLGARPAALDAETHDRMLAAVSHLPHVLANVLVAQAAARALGRGRAAARDRAELPRHDARGRRQHRRSGATSTSPTPTRSSPAIDDTVARLARVRAALAAGDGDAVAAWNDGAREERRRLLEAELAVGAVCELRVSVPNRPGVVAELALALGQAGVNIVDMALAPAADNASGTISLWLDGERHAAARGGARGRPRLRGGAAHETRTFRPGPAAARARSPRRRTSRSPTAPRCSGR